MKVVYQVMESFDEIIVGYKSRETDFNFLNLILYIELKLENIFVRRQDKSNFD